MTVAIALWDSTVIVDMPHVVGEDWRKVIRRIRSNEPVGDDVTVKIIKRKK